MKLLAQMLDRALDSYPEREAFRCQQQRLTYSQLAQRANQLANTLISVGIEPGDRVAIYMPRCVESAIAVFGILKAGAVFVPIDVNAPPVVVADLLSDCDIAALVTHPGMTRLIRRLTALPSSLKWVFGVDSKVAGGRECQSWSEIHSAVDADPGVSASSNDLAYIIHTSGSTGKPKGIMHSNFSGLSYARLSAQTYCIGADDVIGSHAPLHTDMSTLGFLTGPFAGATTVIVPETHTRLPASLCSLLATEGITIWYSVPLALVQMLSTELLSSLDTTRLRWVLYGGEPFSLKHLRALAALVPTAQISNVYGPAEVNQCTHFDLPANAVDSYWFDRAETLPIGKVWPETKALVVDTNDQRVAIGAPGELLISSVTMMQGYWARPDLNVLAFYQHTLGDRQLTFYRTGDIVRQEADGLLYLVGRKDRQVKVRGFRVELDYVELTLTGHPEISEIAVYPVYRETENTSVLEAVAIATDSALTANSLLDYARSVLPDAAVPQRIYLVNSLPRTTSGKIDRRLLQAQSASQQDFS